MPDTCRSLERHFNDAALSPLVAYAFDVADQIADDIYPVDIVIRDFHIDELILDHDHQFQTVEPIGPQIISEVCFIRYTFDVDAQMVGNESADIFGGKAFFHGRCSSTRCQATDGHDKPPVSLKDLGIRPSNPPFNVMLLEILLSVAITSQTKSSDGRASRQDTEIPASATR
jgi:hypothetical protein